MAKVPPPSNYVTVKRGPSAPLSGSSSEGENSDLELEDVPPSPCSSTSSGPIYVRPAGFKHHAHEIQASTHRTCSSVKLKKKIKKNIVPTESLFRHQGIHSRIDRNNNNCNNNNILTCAPPNKIKQKPKKEPLPMKLRALPQSFWQQPNTVNAAPGSMYPVLPPVSKTDQGTIAEITDVWPITPTSDLDEKDVKPVTKSERLDRVKSTEKLPSQDTFREGAVETVTTEVVKTKPPKPPPPRRIVRVSAAGSSLLAKLFDGVDGDKKSTMTPSVKRGRPKRDCSHAHHSKHLVGDDPYMIDAVADGLLPLLSIESNRQSVGPSSHLSVVSVKDGDKTFSLPSLSIEQNYPAMLSELVKAL